ncbi:MAG: hypothetical protein RLZZ303_1806, partial [Candidatus Hydrogenedentota bacterium]
MAAPTGTKRQSAIAQALLKEGVIDQKQLDRALRVQSLLEEPKQLADVLIELGYAKRNQITDAIAKHGSSMRLGEMLVEQGIITSDTLELALATQEERKMRLGEALLAIGAINERTLLRNIAHQARALYIEPSFTMIDSSVLKGVSPDYLSKHGFVPFSKSDDGTVTAVVTDIHNDQLKHTVSELYQGNVIFALGPDDCVKATIEDFRRYRQEDKKETAESTPGEMAVQLVNHILGQAVEEGASDIHIEP